MSGNPIVRRRFLFAAGALFAPPLLARDFDGAFQAMKVERAQAALVLADPLTYAYRMRLAVLAVKHRLPAVGSLHEYAEAGFLMSYWADGSAIVHSTVRYVDQILKGATRPPCLSSSRRSSSSSSTSKPPRPSASPSPPSILLRADEVIQ